jgi:hypothetical protein
MSVWWASLLGSDSKIRSSTTGGGSTGRRSADAIRDVQRRRPRLDFFLLTLCSCTTGSGSLWLLHHAQFVRELFAFSSNPADRVFGLIVRWHDGWSGRHFRGLTLLFPVIPSYSAGRDINNTSECDGDFVDSWCATYNPAHNPNPVSSIEIRGVQRNSPLPADLSPVGKIRRSDQVRRHSR